MSGAFEALDIANSSLGMHQTWLDALAGNIANINTASRTSEKAFQARYVVAQSDPGGGVSVAGIDLGDAAGKVVSDPSSPLADKDGNVRMSSEDLNSEMTELIAAQRGYQASVEVTKNAQDNYTSALEIGKNS